MSSTLAHPDASDYPGPAMAAGAARRRPAARAAGAHAAGAHAAGAKATEAQAADAKATEAQADEAKATEAQADEAKATEAQAAECKATEAQASGGQAMAEPGIPDATVARLPVYLRALYSLAERGVATVASEELASLAGVNSAKLRKDLSHLGSYGIRGVGYDVDYLVYQVSRALGLTQNWSVAIVGAGNLGRALANYGGFASRGFAIAALFDSDPALVGKKIGTLTVRHSDELENVISAQEVAIGAIATPAGAAQQVCDRLVAAGVTSILNFAPLVLSVPEGVDVRKVDLSIELQILAFHAQRRSAARAPGAAGTELAEPRTVN